MTDLLDPSALLQVLPTLLPSTTPLLQSPSDALAALIHTLLTRLDFRLTGLSEDDRLPTPTEPPSSSSASGAMNKLPSNWNASAPSHYAFRYKHHQSSLDFLIKIVKLGSKAVIHGIALQGTRTSTLEVVLTDYISTSFWPYPREGGEEPLVNGFIGSSRVKDFTGLFKREVLQQLVPGLRKDGYQEETNSSTSGGGGGGSGSATQPSRPEPSPQPRPPFAGDEDDPTQPSSSHPYRNPLIIGDRDLDPLGGSPLALPPRFGGGGNFAPPPLFPGGDSGGGMFVGPDHPMFRNRHPPPQTGLPPGAVPPGARFDPIFPGGGPGPFRPAGGEPDVGGARPQTGDPDWDELAPPRGENPFAGRGGFAGRGRGRGGFGGGADTSGWYA